ncbi:TRAP-type C4-dicarboxylate transport system, periplasmic component [Marinobacterium lacunae]|uniref:TRAP-type C4-dicarboxylate transport system, periplasmic component n=1 Tax=Marinobacterium lacunae TaxID=1232683 RepID=A0A081FUR2_9GAMM|nr:TRAP transporter substrate-binding protein [Marinobacterium lacunae]KEA62267.1 TRAP-type C4-dicarboxylate transport system, periplasmic component [Marinobacterium lacunae]
MNLIRKSLLALSVSSIAATTLVQAEQLTFAHGANPGNPRYEAAEMFAAIVPSCSAMTVNHAPSATVGNDAEMLTSAQAGVIQMSANSQGALAQIVPEAGMLGLPFLFADEPSVWRVLDGKIGEELDKKAQQAGLKIVAFWDNGFRNVSHAEKFVSTPAEMAGMKIRTPPDQVTIDIFKALGANPAPLAWSELPTALRSGAFDGQENPLTNIYSAKLHEITPYISMTGHKYESTPVVAGLGWWNSLSAEDQACISSAAKQAGWFQRGENMLANRKLQAVMEGEGAKFTTVDREALIKATASVYDKYEGQLGAFVSELRAAAQ